MTVRSLEPFQYTLHAHVRGGSVSRRGHNQAYSRHATSQAEPPMQKHPRQTPAALRERGSGGEALLSEKRPLPQNLPRSLTPCPRRIGRKPRRWGRKHEPCRDQAKQRDRTFGEFAADCD